MGWSDADLALAVGGAFDLVSGVPRRRSSKRWPAKGLGGFRNILVHGYLRVDPDRVADYLVKAPTDFSEFVRQVRDWLVRTTST